MTTESRLQTILASAFDQYAIHRQVRVGDRHAVYEVTVDGRRAACKLTENDPELLAREGTVLRAVARHTPVRVPEVLDAGEGHLLLEWVQGDPYERDIEGERCRSELRLVGETLARLHDATADWFAGHGMVSPETEPLTVENPVPWDERLLNFVDNWASELAGTAYAETGQRVVETAGTYRDLFADCSPVLVHGEVKPAHVRFDGQDTPVLVDWEVAQAAPGAFDLVWAERDLLGRPVSHDNHSTRRTALFDGYGNARELPRGFHVRCEVYRAAFAMRELTIVADAEQSTPSSDDRGTGLQRYVFERLGTVDSMLDDSSTPT